MKSRHPKQLISAIILTTATLAPLSSPADILSIGAQPKVAMTAQAPRKGMSMKQVLEKLGEPAKRVTAPGKITKRNPRISVWSYGKLTVYFENSHVIHTVVHP